MKQLNIKYYSDILLRSLSETGNRRRETGMWAKTLLILSRNQSLKAGIRFRQGTALFFGTGEETLWTSYRNISLGQIIGTSCIVLWLCLGSISSTLAQRPVEKIETARIAFLTERLSLTPETAQQFWPVYNQWDEQRKELKKEEFKLRRSGRTDELNDDTAQQHIDEYLSLKERQLDLEKSMVTELSEVLSSTQIIQLIRAEADFQRTILRKLGERRRGGDRRSNMPR